MSLMSVGYRQVEAIVQTWTSKYQYNISLLESKPNQVRYMVEFSLATPQKPIPIGTIRVYFTCKDLDGLNITFRFQKDSLIHSVNKTIRHKQVQKWIDDALAKKLLVRQTVFYLGTAYESTRVKDVRQDKILEKKIVEEEKQFVYIHPDLLSDQKRAIQIMEKPHENREQLQKQLKTHFSQIDKDNIGVLTHPQFITLIKNIGIKLSSKEEKDLLKRVDPQQSGMIEYANYKGPVVEILESLEAKKLAELKLLEGKEEQIFGSILMLMSDQAQDIEEQMIQKFKAKDEDETGFTNISQAKAVLEEINKKAKEDNKPEPLNSIQMAELAKILTDLYGYKEIPYAKIHKHIIDLKVGELTVGRVNSSMNNLEVHLREIFDNMDDKKLGKIKLQAFQQALKRSEKVKLTKAQLYLLKNIIPIEQKGQIKEVNYIQNSKFLSEIIKKFYIHSSKRKE